MSDAVESVSAAGWDKIHLGSEQMKEHLQSTDTQNRRMGGEEVEWKKPRKFHDVPFEYRTLTATVYSSSNQVHAYFPISPGVTDPHTLEEEEEEEDDGKLKKMWGLP